MAVGWREQLRPGIALREIVTEATASLIAMDTERLEELALCCADLNRGMSELPEINLVNPMNSISGGYETRHALEQAAKDLRLLDRVLYETRANLTVLSRLYAIRLSEAQALQDSMHEGTRPPSGSGRPGSENSYGDN